MTRKPRPIRIEGDVAYVPLTKGYEAMIDAVDIPLVDAWNWCSRETRRPDGVLAGVYAQRNKCNGERYLHRHLLGAPAGCVVDHIDGDPLNNRRSNLRLASCAQNQHNAKARLDNSTGTKGVCPSKGGKFRAYVHVAGKQVHIGVFDDVETAALHAERRRGEIHGEFARLF
jgi:hypothetical protein